MYTYVSVDDFVYIVIVILIIEKKFFLIKRAHNSFQEIYSTLIEMLWLFPVFQGFPDDFYNIQPGKTHSFLQET